MIADIFYKKLENISDVQLRQVINDTVRHIEAMNEQLYEERNWLREQVRLALTNLNRGKTE
jgi:hypothetical protein